MRGLSLAAVMLVWSVGLWAQEAAPAASAERTQVRLLTVGNSFADNAARYLGQIAEAAGCKLVLGKANIGGCPLNKHWQLAEKHEADPAAPEGKPYGKKGEGKSLQEMLQSQPWDFVTIQQFSYISHDVKTYQPYATNLRDYIKKHAPQAEVLLHETWAYRSDDPRFSGQGNNEPRSQDEMYQQLRAAYETTATELGARLIPCGDAFHLADTDAQWGYQADTRFDFKKAEYPNLPEQKNSLHIGWRWKKDKDGTQKLGMDGHHAGVAGEYLGGCVFFEILFGRSVLENSFTPPGLSPEYAKFLRQIAHQAVEQRAAAPKP